MTTTPSAETKTNLPAYFYRQYHWYEDMNLTHTDTG